MGYKTEFAKAKRVNLYEYCSIYEPDKWSDEGNNTMRHKDMSSLIVSRYTTIGRSLFFDNKARHGIEHGDAIDYLRLYVYPDTSFREVVSMLASAYDAGVSEDMGDFFTETRPKHEYVLPARDEDASRIYDYLCGRRCINKSIVDTAIANDILFQTTTEKGFANAIFRSDEYLWAEIRGTGCKKFCRTLSGSDRDGYWAFTFDGDTFDKVGIICEGGIDALSLADIYLRTKGLSEASKYAYISTGGVSKSGAIKKCMEYFNRIILSPDNDSAGDEVVKRLRLTPEFEDMEILRPSLGKDWNDYLVYIAQRRR